MLTFWMGLGMGVGVVLGVFLAVGLGLLSRRLVLGVD